MRFVVGGAIDKQRVAAKIREAAGTSAEVAMMSDIEAAQAVKAGKADYYLGACATGGGGALALAMAILGASRCAIVSVPGRFPREEVVERAVREGKVAFGFTSDHVDAVVPTLVRCIVAFVKNKEEEIT